MSAQVAADLRAAADVLERDGWRQGELVDSYGCRCVLGAMDAAAPLRREDAVEQMWNALADVVGTRAIVKWNDAPGRTADEVIAALRTAADRAEAEQ